MLKYVDTKIVFAEVPDEITLAISISNCQVKCKGCHSSYLANNIGEKLNIETLKDLITSNKGITCVCFMGEGNSPKHITDLAKYIKLNHSNLRVAYYTGYDKIQNDIDINYFDYIKVGGYNSKLGGLNNKKTNQIMYKIEHNTDGNKFINITEKFWKNEN